MSYKADAKASGEAKMKRMGIGSSLNHRGPHPEMVTPYEKPSAAGVSRARDIPVAIQGEKAKARLDRAGYARGGKVAGKKGTTVNVIVAPGGQSGGPQAVPVPVPVGGPPPMPPRPMMPPPGAGGPMAGPPGGMPPGAMPPGGMPMRARGGRIPKVKMDAGAGGGLGRLEKVKEYGAKSRKG